MPAVDPCRLSQDLELKQHSLKLLEERMAGSEAAQLSEAVAASEAELAEAQAAVAAAQAKKAEMVAAAKVQRRCGRGGGAPSGRQGSVVKHGA